MTWEHKKNVIRFFYGWLKKNKKVSVFSSAKRISSVPLLKQLASFYIYETTLSITNKQYYRFIKTNSPTSKRVRLVTKVLSSACLSSIIMMPSIWQIKSTKNSSLPLSFMQHQIYTYWHFQRSSFLILYAIMGLSKTKPFPALLCLDTPIRN